MRLLELCVYRGICRSSIWKDYWRRAVTVWIAGRDQTHMRLSATDPRVLRCIHTPIISSPAHTRSARRRKGSGCG